MKNILLNIAICLFILPPSVKSEGNRNSGGVAHPVISRMSPKSKKPRTIITTDGEIDDVDSFIRMLLYANEFNIEGLIYSSSQWHYKGDGKATRSRRGR